MIFNGLLAEFAGLFALHQFKDLPRCLVKENESFLPSPMGRLFVKNEIFIKKVNIINMR